MLLPLLAVGVFAPLAHSEAARPNVILVITDDQGYGDLGCHGNPVIKTPHIDKLHGESARLTRYHVSPTCAPTRAALLTGRHEFFSGITHTIQERERLALTATTFPTALKAAGYATGIFGKWHLGDEDAYQPGKRGFDETFIFGAGGIGQTYPGSCGDVPGNKYTNPTMLHNGRFEKTAGYCTDVFFDRALGWIEKRKDAGPFYCQIATNAPHAPLDCPPEYAARYAGKVPPDVAKFYGMITNIDDNVGKLLGKLTAWGLDQNTVVIFTTDNGTATGEAVFNAGMRGKKGTPYLGGTRVPCFVRWPGVVKPGDVPALAAHIDWFPTLLAITGATAPAGTPLDGRNLLPVLKDPTAAWPDRTVVSHVGRWPTGKAAISKYGRCSI
ncbi:MAG: arylsulfatase, partial [Fimbriiglobus sp.]